MERIERDEQFRKSRMECLARLRERFAGPGYSSRTNADDEYFPENFYYKFLGLMVPRLVYDNPRVWVKTRRPGSQGEVAEAMRHGMNRWTRDSKLRKTLEDLAYDMLFSWGASLTTIEELPEVRGQANRWPKLYRIPPERFGLDSYALHPREARYAWHMLVRDKDDLIKLAKQHPKRWNLDVIQDLTEGAGVDKLKREADGMSGESRKEIVYYEIWYPEHHMEGFSPADGFHGTIYTLAVGQAYEGDDRADFIRAPRPYYGPKRGPYGVYGCYRVPNELWPLGPLTALEGQISDLNAQVIAAHNANRRHKRFGIVQSTDPLTDQVLANARDGRVYGLKNFDRTKFTEMEVGGVTEEQRRMIFDLRMLLSEVSGLSDPQTGSPSGEGTATEHAIADQASTTRNGYIRRQFQDAVSSDLEAVAWYMYHDDKIEFPLGQEAAQELGAPLDQDLLFRGGVPGEGTGYSFEDLELEIEAFSMERTDETLLQRRMAEMDQLVTAVAPIMPQVPWVDWKQYFYLRGTMANFPELGRIVDPQVAAQFAGMGELPPSGAENQPRLGKDLGALPALAQGRSQGAQSGADRQAGGGAAGAPLAGAGAGAGRRAS